ncbi:glycosyltransferase [Undibacterium terreum]|uniref:Glycosyl transferase n=1 Tax=Undibacterium terreum TaxID=1224302 RepID=A0A916U8M7_9BURK|nr:glycosyltransferase [Undibacterium terreum]GGC64661.1 glycosyl transferase [Undibacterium terreum]
MAKLPVIYILLHLENPINLKEPLSEVAIVLPAYNEELTIAATISAFHEQLPHAYILVVNNNSADATEEIANATLQKLGARGAVVTEARQGKGYAVRRAFAEIHADVYVMADADLTYPAERVHDLIAPVMAGTADMVVGDRQSMGHYKNENKRPLHNFGNWLVSKLINKLFSAKLVDIMSGYRAFNRQFVKTYSILVAGFQIETDMSLHALDKRFRIVEIPVEYKDRPAGSFSKLNTFGDGAKVLLTIVKILRFYRPLMFFGWAAILFGMLGLLAAVPVFSDWIAYRFIYHVPLALLAAALELVAVMSLAVGLILDAISYQAKMDFERHLLR